MKKIALVMIGMGLIVTSGVAGAADVSGLVTDIAGRVITVKDVKLTLPPPQAGQPDNLADIHKGEIWSFSYDAGSTNTVTQAVKEPDYGNAD
jgi:hypothetical protein